MKRPNKFPAPRPGSYENPVATQFANDHPATVTSLEGAKRVAVAHLRRIQDVAGGKK